MKDKIFKKSKEKRTKKQGFMLVIALLLLLIISMLALAFFTLQYFEVDLIAFETDYIQAFYLANAALEQGTRQLFESVANRSDTNSILRKMTQAYFDANILARLTPGFESVSNNLDKRSLDCDYIISQNPNNIFSIWGIARINQTVRNIRRYVSLTITKVPSSVIIDSNSPFYPFFELIMKIKDPTILGNASLTVSNKFDSYSAPLNLAIIAGEILRDQGVNLTGLSNSRADLLSIIQENAINEFESANTKGTKYWINFVRTINAVNNDNKELFNSGDGGNIIYNNYEKLGDSSSGYKWNNSLLRSIFPEFYYEETRNSQKTRLNSNKITFEKDFTLEAGIYYFWEMTIKSNVTLNTNGPVIIFTTGCRLEDGAKLVGGMENPDNLLLIAEKADNDQPPGGFSKQGIIMESASNITGHIFAPDGKIIINAGKNQPKNTPTKINGSVLVSHLVSQMNNPMTSSLPVFEINFIPSSFTVTFTTNVELQIVPGSWHEVNKDEIDKMLGEV